MTRIAALLATAALAWSAAVGVVLTPTAASAAGCTSATGVTVVVDFNGQGGQDLAAACVSGGGGDTAASLFTSAGFDLEYASGSGGFVCRVSGYPTGDVCSRTPPATAYWALWWSDGKTGDWVYSSRGVTSLTVPDGGYVAFAWHTGSGKTQPGTSPTPRQAASPTPAPSSGGGASGGITGGTGGTGGKGSAKPSPKSTPTKGSGTAGGTNASATPSASATPTASTTATPSASSAKKEKKQKAEPTPSASATSSAVPVEDITSGPPEPVVASDGEGDGGGFPMWLAGLLAGVVLGAAGAVPVIRSRR